MELGDDLYGSYVHSSGNAFLTVIPRNTCMLASVDIVCLGILK